jgi:glycosyltransferase involved in cell wall biosynthesis
MNTILRIFCFGSDYPPTQGGISTHTKEWLAALSEEKGIRVRATIFGNKEPRTEKVGDVIELTTVRSVNFFSVGLRIFKDMWRYRHYNVIHSFNLFPVGFWVVFWSKIFRKKSVVTFYGQDACDRRTSAKVVWLQKWTLTNATKCITISEFSKKKVLERYNLGHNTSDRAISVVHPILPHFEDVGHESTKDVKKPPNENIRQKFGIGKTDFVLVSVSRLVKRKGIEYQIEAISKISDTTVKLIIVGGGPEREKLEEKAKQLGVTNRVFFAGKVPLLAPYYKAANAAALTSYIIEEEGDFEGLGLVLLEAQSYGLPVIGTKSGGIPETFEDGKTGILVAERNTDEIVNAILQLKKGLVDDPAAGAILQKELSQNTADFLKKEFGKENTVIKYLNLLRT